MKKLLCVGAMIYSALAYASISQSTPLIIVNGSGASTYFLFHGSTNGGSTVTLGDGQACSFPPNSWDFNKNGRFYIQDLQGSYNAMDFLNFGGPGQTIMLLNFASDLGDSDAKSKHWWNKFYNGNGSAWNNCSAHNLPGKWIQSTQYMDENICAYDGANRPIIIGIAGQNGLSSNVQSPDYYIQQYGNNLLPQCFH